MNKTQINKQPDLPTYLNYNKLIFHEDLWPDVVGRTRVLSKVLVTTASQSP